MSYRFLEVRYVSNYLIWARFSEDTEDTSDLAGAFEDAALDPLDDETLFLRNPRHPELHALVWPHGGDYVPEFLHYETRDED